MPVGQPWTCMSGLGNAHTSLATEAHCEGGAAPERSCAADDQLYRRFVPQVLSDQLPSEVRQHRIPHCVVVTS